MTTRHPRPGEIDGQHYFFATPAEFDRLIAENGLLEWAEVHGNRYGTPKSAVEEHLARGQQVILEIDPQGAFQVRDLMPGSVLVFITTPSIEELARRLSKRGSETKEQVAARLKTAEQELALVGKYAHVIINDDVARAAGELASIIRSYCDDEES